MKLTKQEVNSFNEKTHLLPQFYEDIPNLDSNSMQVMSRQATINIGTIGHVSHGKSTLVQAMSNIDTAKYRDEKKFNKSIRLGYANIKIYQCPKCPAPQCYQSFPSNAADNLPCTTQDCDAQLKLIRHVSFCDCPGHDAYLSTMLAGVSVIDAALLLVAANEQCPQPQTVEHIKAIKMMQLKNTIIIQSKIDLVFHDKEKIKQNYKQIKQFMKDTPCKTSPIVPISAQLKYNIDAILEEICKIPVPKKNLSLPPKMIIVRSFDVNRPGADIDELVGGVVGGSIIEGVLEVGMEVEIRPGIIEKDSQSNIICTPIKTRVASLFTEQNKLLYAIPGGLIGVGLLIDPSLTRNNSMVGNILGAVDTLPNIYSEVQIKYELNPTVSNVNVSLKQTLKFNFGSTETPGNIVKIMDDIIKVRLDLPVCVNLGEKVAIRRKLGKKYRLVGDGEVKGGTILMH